MPARYHPEHVQCPPHHPAHLGMSDLGLVEIALATAAAPTYFPIARIGDGDYVDAA